MLNWKKLISYLCNANLPNLVNLKEFYWTGTHLYWQTTTSPRSLLGVARAKHVWLPPKKKKHENCGHRGAQISSQAFGPSSFFGQRSYWQILSFGPDAAKNNYTNLPWCAVGVLLCERWEEGKYGMENTVSHQKVILMENPYVTMNVIACDQFKTSAEKLSVPARWQTALSPAALKPKFWCGFSTGKSAMGKTLFCLFPDLCRYIYEETKMFLSLLPLVIYFAVLWRCIWSGLNALNTFRILGVFGSWRLPIQREISFPNKSGLGPAKAIHWLGHWILACHDFCLTNYIKLFQRLTFLCAHFGKAPFPHLRKIKTISGRRGAVWRFVHVLWSKLTNLSFGRRLSRFPVPLR